MIFYLQSILTEHSSKATASKSTRKLDEKERLAKIKARREAKRKQREKEKLVNTQPKGTNVELSGSSEV